MSARPTDVVDPLDRLASHAPATGLDPEALWSRGRRRQRRRAAAVVAGIVMAGVVATGVTPSLLARVDRPVAASSDQLVLPDVLEAPGGWAPAFDGLPRRLSAVGVGQRAGLWSTSAALWGVSAATGEARWLDLPDAVPTAGADAQLSPDGRRLAYWVTGEVSGTPLSRGATEDDVPVVGLAVIDLATGEVQRWDVDSEHGLTVTALVWSGDVLWWQGGPVVPLGAGASTADLTTHTWDLATGERTDVSGKDPRAGVYLTQPGQAPDGFVTLPRTFQLEQVTGERAPVDLRVQLPSGAPSTAGLVDAQMAPDGSRVAALMIADATSYDDTVSKELVVGEVADGVVELAPVDGRSAQSLLGWRSEREVLVSSPTDIADGVVTSARVSSVDTTTGESSALLDVTGTLPVTVAADAWAGEVVAAPGAPFAPDPRVVGVLLLGAALVVWRVVVAVRRRHVHA